MTDRVQLLLDLGVLQAEATQRGDDRAVDTLRRVAGAIMELQAEASALEKRRRNERERQRTSRESRDKRDGPSPLSHSPPTQKTDATQVPAPDLEEITHRRCAMLSEAVGPELWPDVDAFLKRRDYWTWKSWADEMLKLVGPGSQYTPSDLAQVCRDDGALSRPIGSPFGLRRFIGNAQRERTEPAPDMKPRRRVRGDAGDRSYLNAREALGD